MIKNLKKWVILGTIFIIILGTLAHFIYEWSGNNPIAGIFVAINESTWEHIKIAIFPTLILMIFQSFFFKKNSNFLVASFVSMMTMIILIPLIFYGYQIFLADALIFDIIDFIVSIIIGQLLFYKIMQTKELPKVYKQLSVMGIIIIIFSYLLLSYFPPKNFIFKDPVTNTYGINQNVE